MDIITIDGQDFSELVEGLDGLQIDIGLDDDTNTYVVSTGTGLVFTGEGFEYIKNKFFAAGCNGIKSVLGVRIYKECCDLWFDFNINYEGVTICFNECTVDVSLREVTEEDICYDKLAGTLIHDKGFAEAFNHPLVNYCETPAFVWFIGFYIRLVLAQFLIVIDIIEGALGFLGINLDLPSINNIDNALTGCDKYIVAPRILDILNYHAELCGLTLKSSILNSPVYRNMVLFSIEGDDGISRDLKTQNRVQWLTDHGPFMTVVDVLESLKPVFNADYTISNGVLCFERKDFFKDLKQDVLNTDEAFNDGLIDDDYCITMSQDNACAFGRFEYTKDSMDTVGNNAFVRNYAEIVEWNENLDAHKSGECRTTTEYAPMVGQFDAATDDNGSIEFINKFRRGSGLIYTNLADHKVDRAVLLRSDQLSQKKLLILEDGYDPDEAYVIRRQISEDNWDYNYPLYFDEDYPEPELYQRFHYIDNPDEAGRQIYSISSIKIPMDCDIARQIQNATNGISVTTPLGLGVVGTVSLVFNGDENYIELSDIEIYCE